MKKIYWALIYEKNRLESNCEEQLEIFKTKEAAELREDYYLDMGFLPGFKIKKVKITFVK
jgi:hypothetical protein